MPKTLLVFGGRAFNDRARVWRGIDAIAPDWLILGGCPPNPVRGDIGADELGRLWAADRQIPHVVYPAPFKVMGKRGGPWRNRQMGEMRPDLALRFPGGAGTASMSAICAELGIKITDG